MASIKIMMSAWNLHFKTPFLHGQAENETNFNETNGKETNFKIW